MNPRLASCFAAALTTVLLIATALASFSVGVEALTVSATDLKNQQPTSPEWLAQRGVLSMTPILWDNIGNPPAPSGSLQYGPPAAFEAGYSNFTLNQLSDRRTLIDDFVVPAGVAFWTITDFHWRHSWATANSTATKGFGVDIRFFDNNPNAGGPDQAGPGTLIAALLASDYQEKVTGRTTSSGGDLFHEMESSVNVSAVNLLPGKYWVEFAISGPENNFGWARSQLFEPAWVNYSDISGLEQGASIFGVDRDLMWALTGTATLNFERCNPDAITLCIDDEPDDGRYQIRVAYETSQAGGQSGFGTPTPLASIGVHRGGLMTFFGAENPEMVIKVLDGCSINGNKWIFYAAGTNVGLETEVTDTLTGRQVVYTNLDLNAALPVQDVGAFPCDGSAGSVFTPEAMDFDFDRDLVSGSGPQLPCIANDTTLCIDDETGDKRWQIRVAFMTSQAGGVEGLGSATPLSQLGVDRGGLMTFFSADNPEMLIKVLDGCSINGYKWVFYSATTNVALETTVTDTQTGSWVQYLNPDRNAAPPVQHTAAFSCSPS